MSDKITKNSTDIKYFNRINVLRLVATNKQISRAMIVDATGISKMSASNVASDLINAGFLKEAPIGLSELSIGRGPQMLSLSDTSPCILGVYIGRKHLVVYISDLSLTVLDRRQYVYDSSLDENKLIGTIIGFSKDLILTCRRKVITIGVSSIGPINSRLGIILTPPHFYNLKNIPIVDILSSQFNLPCYLCLDGMAVAIVEALYGGGKTMEDFIALIIKHGIGSGIVINGKPVDGNTGLGGAIGHTSIDRNGPRCTCGNNGCLENYANEKQLLRDYLRYGGNVSFIENEDVVFPYLIGKAARGDGAALKALEDFATPLSQALVNIISVVSLNHVILSYTGENNGILEKLVRDKISSHIIDSVHRQIYVVRSTFEDQGQILGAAALAAGKIFDGTAGIDLFVDSAS